MEYRTLGTNGPEVPVLGFGAWPICGGMGAVEKTTAINAVHKAIDCGISLIDTAQMYRDSESILGEALQGGWRDRCFLASKVTRDFSRKGIEAAMDDSLRALRVDHLDLYQVHYWNPKFPIAETMETMAELQQRGKTRYIGVSNFSAPQMEAAWAVSPFQSSQPCYNLIDRELEGEDLAWSESHCIGILAHSVLAKGLLTGKYSPGHKFPADDERSRFDRFQGESLDTHLRRAKKLKEIARQKGITMVQLAIAWVLRLEPVTCALVGVKSPGQVDEYLGVVGVTFDASELEAIDLIMAG